MLWASLALGSILSLVASYGIATQSIVLGSLEGRWVYGYLQPSSVRSLTIFLLVSVLACALLGARGTVSGRHPWRLILVWMLVALGLQALLRSLTPFSLERMFISNEANAFYGVARRYDATTVLSEFETLRAYWPLHAQSNMPGKLMLVYALEHISRRPDILAWLVVVLSNLGGPLLYVFVQDLFGDRRVAFFSAVLYFFVPAKLFFFPLMNTATPVVVLLCASLLLRWLVTGRSAYAVFLGLALYGLVFFEPLPLVMGLLFSALAARALWRADIAWHRLLAQSGLVVLAFAATYTVVYAWFGFDLIDAFQEIGAHAVAFNATAGRPYSIWIRQNLRDFIFGIGACQALLFCAALGDGLRRSDAPSGRLAQPITVLCLGLLGVLLATDFIGVNRGEVIRLWIFLACFFQVPAAYVCARLESRAALALVLVTTVLQDALGTAMIGFILPG